MRHEHIRGRCLNLAAREDTERGRGNILCKEREFVAKLQGFQNSNFYDFKMLFPSNEVFTLHYKSVLLYLLFLLGGHLTFDSLGAHSKKSACSARGLALIPGLARSPGEGNGNPPTPVLLPGEFHGQRSLVSYSPWGPKESDTTEQLSLTHSHLIRSYSILFLG